MCLFNGPVYVIKKVIEAVMRAASEDESGAAFINAQDTVRYLMFPLPIDTYYCSTVLV